MCEHLGLGRGEHCVNTHVYTHTHTHTQTLARKHTHSLNLFIQVPRQITLSAFDSKHQASLVTSRAELENFCSKGLVVSRFWLGSHVSSPKVYFFVFFLLLFFLHFHICTTPWCSKTMRSYEAHTGSMKDTDIHIKQPSVLPVYTFQCPHAELFELWSLLDLKDRRVTVITASIASSGGGGGG